MVHIESIIYKRKNRSMLFETESAEDNKNTAEHYFLNKFSRR